MRIVWTTPDDSDDTEIDGRGYIDPVSGEVVWNEGVMAGLSSGRAFWEKVFFRQLNEDHPVFFAVTTADNALKSWKKRWGGKE